MSEFSDIFVFLSIIILPELIVVFFLTTPSKDPYAPRVYIGKTWFIYSLPIMFIVGWLYFKFESYFILVAMWAITLTLYMSRWIKNRTDRRKY